MVSKVGVQAIASAMLDKIQDRPVPEAIVRLFVKAQITGEVEDLCDAFEEGGDGRTRAEMKEAFEQLARGL
jgi:hypothetical protein